MSRKDVTTPVFVEFESGPLCMYMLVQTHYDYVRRMNNRFVIFGIYIATAD